MSFVPLKFNTYLKEKKRDFIFVLNKYDIAPKSAVIEAKKKLKFAPVMQVSCKTGMGIDYLRRKIYTTFDAIPECKRKVGLLGYPNMGKSSLINRLSGRTAAKVSSQAGFTRSISWIRGRRMELVDGPGYIESKEKRNQLEMALINSQNAEDLPDPEMVAYEITKEMMLRNRKEMERFYDVKFPTNDPADAIETIGKRFGHLKRGGKIETKRTAIVIIKDWQQGRLKIKNF